MKTTGKSGLSYADALVVGDQELYGGDGRTVSGNRVSPIKNRLESEHRMPDHLLARLPKRDAGFAS